MPLPLNDLIAAAMAKLVDDSKPSSTREPSHSDLDFDIQRAGLTNADPKFLGQTVGKAKRVRAVLSWAIDHDPSRGERLVELLLTKVRAVGGFRPTSSNYVGDEAIQNAIASFDSEGFLLANNGEIQAKVLSTLTGRELTEALLAYARRAQKGAHDAALLSGTGKDLLEATAAHIIQSKFGKYPEHANFRMLLGQAYIALGMTVPEQEPQAGESAMKKFERSMFEMACAVNVLRNKEGTGHGRPWVTNISNAEGAAAVEFMGVISGFLLDKLSNR